MKPYILKWDGGAVGHLYNEDKDKINRSVATIWASTPEERERFELWVANANFVWMNMEGVTGNANP